MDGDKPCPCQLFDPVIIVSPLQPRLPGAMPLPLGPCPIPALLHTSGSPDTAVAHGVQFLLPGGAVGAMVLPSSKGRMRTRAGPQGASVRRQQPCVR